MITERDFQIFALMSEFGGKTFLNVLSQTFFENEQVARNRLNILKKDKMIKFVKTGLMSPRNAIYPTDAGLRYFKEKGLKTVVTSVSSSTVEHLVIEQIAYFYLKKIGKNVERTIVKNHSKSHAHTPDLAYVHDQKKVYIEIERTIKREDELAKIFLNIKKDDVHAIIYVFENEKKMAQIATKIPIFEKVHYVTIDALKSASKDGKIGAIKQIEYLKKIGEK